MGVSGQCRVTNVHSNQILTAYRRALGEYKYCSRTEPDTARSDLIQRKCLALAQAVLCLQPEIEISSVPPIRFWPRAPLTNNQTERAILAELRRNKNLRSPESLAGTLLAQHEISLIPTAEHNAFLRQVISRLNALAKHGLVVSTGDGWTVRPPSDS